MIIRNLKTGDTTKDPINGWCIMNENGVLIYLCDDKDKYIETYKRLKNITSLSEAYSEKAQRIIWKNTDKKNVCK